MEAANTAAAVVHAISVSSGRRRADGTKISRTNKNRFHEGVQHETTIDFGVVSDLTSPPSMDSIPSSSICLMVGALDARHWTHAE